MEIEKIIQQKLDEIEQKEQVRVLLSVESGSRAWGFASPDSDYDVRFIYVRPQAEYLRLEKQRDVIEWQLDDTLDINGWDLQKALRLLHKSNPTLFEWNNSPIIYRTTPYWESIRGEISAYFQSKAGLYHYLSMAKTNYHAYFKGEQVKLKKYFYSLRPVLCARWIIDKGTPPPMPFSELAAEELDGSVASQVEELLRLKADASEKDNHEHIAALDKYLENSISKLSETAQSISQTGSKEWEPLDNAFIGLLGL
jgi:predicted nucleotidyltransferase